MPWLKSTSQQFFCNLVPRDYSDGLLIFSSSKAVSILCSNTAMATKLEFPFSTLADDVVVYLNPSGSFPAVRASQLKYFSLRILFFQKHNHVKLFCVLGGVDSVHVVSIPLPTVAVLGTIFMMPELTSLSVCCSLCSQVSQIFLVL